MISFNFFCIETIFCIGASFFMLSSSLSLRPLSRKIHSGPTTLCSTTPDHSSEAYDFFRSIGSPRFVSAPMVDQSELPFRLLVKKNGANLAFSQMMHAKNFVNDPKYRKNCMDWLDYSHSSSDERKEKEARSLDRPLIAQFAGNDPKILIKAGKFVQNDVSAIDLNLGCPQKIAKRGNYGAYLLEDKEKVLSCLKAMVENLDCPITAKVRCLATPAETLDMCTSIERVGVKMLTVHGRTVHSSKLYTGPADWDIIRQIKQALSIPVIANGGIGCREDALKCLEYTGADAVMSSEALLENPKLFSFEGDKLFRENYIAAQLSTTREYIDLVKGCKAPKPTYPEFRSHMFKFLFRFLDAPRNRDLQKTLADGCFEEMVGVIDSLEDRLNKLTDPTSVEQAIEFGYLGKTSWYMRHRNEQASVRIISPRKVKFSSTNDAVTTEDLQRKLDDLKLRLIQKHNIMYMR